MNAIPITSTSSPVWVSFPAQAMPDVDWTDHYEAHRGVMRLFNAHLPGQAGARRAAAGVLFRVDQQPDGAVTVLIQTEHPVQMLPVTARALTVPRAAWEMPAGQHVMIRVAVNPLTRRTVKREGAKRREATHVLATADVPSWLGRKISTGARILSIANHTRATTRTRGKSRTGAPPQVVIDTIDALAVVTDTAAFDQIRRTGVGRAKSYGCGLLTAIATQ